MMKKGFQPRLYPSVVNHQRSLRFSLRDRVFRSGMGYNWRALDPFPWFPKDNVLFLKLMPLIYLMQDGGPEE
jgi:hypothetical protein